MFAGRPRTDTTTGTSSTADRGLTDIDTRRADRAC
jgi:hypothetical protein